MNYATLAGLISRFGETELVQLTDRTGANAIDTAVVDRAIADAAAEIDGYLQGRYELPLATVPAIITAYACDIARYRLFDDRATEQVTKRYDDAIRFLKLVAKGEVQLGTAPGGDAPDTTGGPAASAEERVFTRENLQDYG